MLCRHVKHLAGVEQVVRVEGLLDGVAVMTRFLHQIASEPDIARVPVMLDSSRWDVLEAGLQRAQSTRDPLRLR